MFTPETCFFVVDLLTSCLLCAASVSASTTIRARLEQNPPLSFMDEESLPAGFLVELLEYSHPDTDIHVR